MSTGGWLPGAVVYGMPIGAPFQRPLPKSAFSPVVAPTLLIQASDRAWTGSVSIRVFQTLSAGNVPQPATGPAHTSVIIVFSKDQES